jgi:hypothetical protein
MEQIQVDKENFEEKRQRAIANEAITVRQLFRKKFEIESIDE